MKARGRGGVTRIMQYEIQKPVVSHCTSLSISDNAARECVNGIYVEIFRFISTTGPLSTSR